MLLAILSLFFTHPMPLDMPRAEAYLVREDGISRLEDRFDSTDLWVSQALIGRWIDEQDRAFHLSALGTCPPAVSRSGTLTRAEYESRKAPMKRVRANADFPAAFRDAISILSPCAVMEKPRSPRQMPRGYKEVYYWQNPTNYANVVCTFLPERTNTWFLASWSLAEGDDYPTQMQAFEDQFLRLEFPSFVSGLRSSGEGRETLDGRRERREGRETLDVRRERREGRETSGGRRERDLLRRDAHHSIAAYANWHFTGAEEFAVLDDLPSRGFVETLTNDFPVMRAKYAAAIPSPLDGSNVLSVVRIYANRGEYLDALEADGMDDMAWSAAYWSPQRRELVAHLSPGGGEELMRTIRHEAFHQYLSYAASMISASPWFNEGYAQYFEDEESADWGEGLAVTDENIDRMSAAIPGVLLMDYEQFYAGSDLERRLKYRLAWSVVRFIEKGADEVRLKPFAGLKKRYMDALIETRDMRLATSAAFKDADLLKKFVAEWRKFWTER